MTCRSSIAEYFGLTPRIIPTIIEIEIGLLKQKSYVGYIGGEATQNVHIIPMARVTYLHNADMHAAIQYDSSTLKHCKRHVKRCEKQHDNQVVTESRSSHALISSAARFR